MGKIKKPRLPSEVYEIIIDEYEISFRTLEEFLFQIRMMVDIRICKVRNKKFNYEDSEIQVTPDIIERDGGIVYRISVLNKDYNAEMSAYRKEYKKYKESLRDASGG